MSAGDHAIKEIAADADFKMYLDAVVGASLRTRATLYLIIVAVIAIYATYRNVVRPDWISARLSQLQILRLELAKSVEPGLDGSKWPQVPASPWKVTEAAEYAEGFMFQIRPSEKKRLLKALGTQDIFEAVNDPFVGKELIRQLNYQIDTLQRRRAELMTLSVPLLGFPLDMNDIAFLGGAVLFSILYALRASIRREGINLETAISRAEVRNPDNLELLLMAQVLAHAEVERPRGKVEKWLSNSAVYAIILLPFFVQATMVFDNIGTWNVGTQLVGGELNAKERLFEWSALILVFGLAALCFNEQLQLNKTFDKLEATVGKQKEARPNRGADFCI